MSLIFALEHAVEKNGKWYESWFNGWPTPEVEQFQEIVQDNIRYNSDLFTTGPDESGIKEWFARYSQSEVAGFVDNNRSELDFCTKRLQDIAPGEKYIYAILMHGGGMLNYSSFQQYGLTINERVLSDCRNGNCKILIHELNEGHGFNLYALKNFIENQSEKLQIPISSIGFLDGNYMTPELQNSYGTKGFCMFFWENHSGLLPENAQLDRIFELHSRTEKKYHFISLNRRSRFHRVPLVAHIMRRWKEKTLFSCDTFHINSIECFNDFNIPSNSPFDGIIKSGLLSREMYESLPITIDVPLTVNDTMVNPSLLSQAYVNITTETMFFESTTQFFSEKVFKPIIYLQPFILLGPYNSLKLLHDMGYKTFYPYIDERYDNEKNPNIRFEMILNEIDRLSKYSHEQMQDLLVNVSPILIHNLMTLKNRRENLIKEKQLIEELKNWTR